MPSAVLKCATIEEHKLLVLESLKNVVDLDDCSYRSLIQDLVKSLPKISNKKTVIDKEELIDAEYNSSLCDGRVWINSETRGKGFSGQCQRAKKVGCFCTLHSKEAIKNQGVLKNGLYNKERYVYHFDGIYGKEEDGDIIPWFDTERRLQLDSKVKIKKTKITPPIKKTKITPKEEESEEELRLDMSDTSEEEEEVIIRERSVQTMKKIMTIHFDNDVKNIKGTVLKKLLQDKIITDNQMGFFIMVKKGERRAP